MWDSDTGKSSSDVRKHEARLALIARYKWSCHTATDFFDEMREPLGIETVFKGSREDLSALRAALWDEGIDYITKTLVEKNGEIIADISISGDGMKKFMEKFSKTTSLNPKDDRPKGRD